MISDSDRLGLAFVEGNPVLVNEIDLAVVARAHEATWRVRSGLLAPAGELQGVVLTVYTRPEYVRRGVGGRDSKYCRYRMSYAGSHDPN